MTSNIDRCHPSRFSSKNTPSNRLQHDMTPRNSSDRLEKEYPRSKIVYPSRVNPRRKITNWLYGWFRCSNGSCHALLSGNAQLIMLTQNSKTESESINLTPESRSAETIIKSVCLNTLDRIKCNLKDWFVTREHGGGLRLIFAFGQITLKWKERIKIGTQNPFSGSFIIN
jgi:hypothetical protein